MDKKRVSFGFNNVASVVNRIEEVESP